MTRMLARRRVTSLGASLAVLALGCRSDGATGGTSAPSQFALHADVSAPVGATLLIRALYLRRPSDGPSSADTVEINRTTIVVQPGTTRLALDLQLASCLADRNRVVPGPTCAVIGEVTLFDGATVLDRAILPPAAIGPGSVVVASGTVVLGNVRSVDVAPATAVVRIGGTTRLVATARDASGNVVPDRSFTWTTDNSAVASVDGSGVVAGSGSGTAHVTATAGGHSGQATITVIPVVASVDITPNPASVNLGSTVALTVTAKDAAGNVVTLTDRTVSWSSSNTQVATITQAGVATGASPGTSTITATVDGISNTDVLTVVGARIVATPAAVTFVGEVGNEPPLPGTVNITNGGAPPLDGLAISVSFAAGQPGGWLDATLTATTAPTTITLIPNTTNLPLGDYTATVRVTSTRPGVTPFDIPVTYQVRAAFMQVVAGRNHTCGLTEFGEAYCWGDNSVGQLGTGNLTSSAIPVKPFASISFNQLYAGAFHTCGVVYGSTNTLWCWGLNDRGQLGDGTMTTRTAAVLVLGNHNISDVALGETHSCLTEFDHSLWCWGYNAFNQLGLGAFPSPSTVLSPGLVSGFDAPYPLALGEFHTCALEGAGLKPHCWGYDNFGQVGQDLGGATTTDGTANNQVNYAFLAQDIQTSAVANHSCLTRGGATAPGELWCWGWNNEGQLGDGTTTTRFLPAKVGTLTVAPFSAAFGQSHTCVLDAFSNTNGGHPIWCWGYDGNGEVGQPINPPTLHYLTPQLLAGFNALELAAGAFHTCGLMDDFQVYCWGNNAAGQLGNGGGAALFGPTPRKVIYTIPSVPGIRLDVARALRAREVKGAALRLPIAKAKRKP